MINLFQGDCLELMCDIPDESIDMICVDPPFQSTKNKWDKEIPIDAMWSQFNRIIKERGCIAIFSQMPFGAKLITSNLQMFKYEWIWQKTSATGFLNSHFAPLKAHENILIFSKSAACYVKNPEDAMWYNPQFGTGKPYVAKNGYGKSSSNYDGQTEWVTDASDGKRFPKDIITFSKDSASHTHTHPTQKPVALLEYLIKTYTDEGMTVLDCCMGSGSTGVACMNTSRNFIGMEKDPKWFQHAKDRLRT